MDKRTLGATGLEITTVGFGAWAVGGPDYAFGWGPQDDDESVGAIQRAVDSGINWIDTAAIYGLGHSERIVARALKALGSSRRPYVFTKCSLRWKEDGSIYHSLEAASLKEEVENSLRRLEIETIDLYQIHWSRPFGSTERAPDIEEGWQTLLDLRREGKVRHIGVSNFDTSEMERVAGRGPIGSLQPQYSLLSRRVEESILPYCQAHNIGVIVYSPMAAGLLSGAMTRERAATLPSNDWRTHNPLFQEPKLSGALALVEVLRGIGNQHGASPGAVAVAWTLRHPAVTAAIVGFRRPTQVDGVVAAAGLRLSADEVREIEVHGAI